MTNGLRNRRTERSPEDPYKSISVSKGKYSKQRKHKGLFSRYTPFMICISIAILMCVSETVASTRHLRRGLSITSKPHCIQLDDDYKVRKLNLSRVLVEQDIDIRYKPRQRRKVVSPREEEGDDDEDEDDCIPLVGWQELSFPTCNSIHEYEMIEDGEYINSGANRDVWALHDWEVDMVLKTLVYTHKFSESYIDKQRIDALISERTTSSEYIADVYGYCGGSAIYDFASDGNLDDVYKDLPEDERLSVAVEVARGLHDLHSLKDENGRTAVVHADIAVRQYLKLDGKFKLNDFNTAGLIYKHRKTGEICPHEVHKAGDKNRAPEEMYHHLNDVTEMIDVYSLGNIFYKLLMNKRKYSGYDVEDAQEMIMNGADPDLSPEIIASDEPLHIALKTAMNMCGKLKPEDRKSAEEVYMYLSTELSKQQGK